MQEPSFPALHKKLGDLFLALFNLSFDMPSYCEELFGFLGKMSDHKIRKSARRLCIQCQLVSVGVLWGGKTPGGLMGKQFIYRC